MTATRTMHIDIKVITEGPLVLTREGLIRFLGTDGLGDRDPEARADHVLATLGVQRGSVKPVLMFPTMVVILAGTYRAAWERADDLGLAGCAWCWPVPNELRGLTEFRVELVDGWRDHPDLDEVMDDLRPAAGLDTADVSQLVAAGVLPEPVKDRPSAGQSGSAGTAPAASRPAPNRTVTLILAHSPRAAGVVARRLGVSLGGGGWVHPAPRDVRGLSDLRVVLAESWRDHPDLDEVIDELRLVAHMFDTADVSALVAEGALPDPRSG